jgi:hypothetical protein
MAKPDPEIAHAAAALAAALVGRTESDPVEAARIHFQCLEALTVEKERRDRKGQANRPWDRGKQA